MKSWVRYCVAVYVGLLLAGSLITSRQAAAGPASLVPPGHGQPRQLDYTGGGCPATQPADPGP